jgi:hypothetical protein
MDENRRAQNGQDDPRHRVLLTNLRSAQESLVQA